MTLAAERKRDDSDSDSGAQHLHPPPSQGNEDSEFLTAVVSAAVLDLLREEMKVFKDEMSAVFRRAVNAQIVAMREEYKIKADEEESERPNMVARLFQLVARLFQLVGRKKPEGLVRREMEDSSDVIAAAAAKVAKAAVVDLLREEMEIFLSQVTTDLRREANQQMNALREKLKALALKGHYFEEEREEEPEPSLMYPLPVDLYAGFCWTPVVDRPDEAIGTSLRKFKMLQSCSVPLGESIGNLLRRGIKQWAPKLPINKALVDFSSPETAGDMHLSHFRAAVIGDSIARMLQSSDVEVLRSTHVTACGSQGWELICPSEWKPMQDDTLQHLRYMYVIAGVNWQYEDGTFYSYKEEVQKKLQENLDNCLSILPTGDVLTELISLGYRIDIQKAEWLIYVTPPEHKDHFNTVFKWANCARWLPDDDGYPKASHISAEKLSNTSRDLLFINLIKKAKSYCLTVLNLPPQTVEAVAYAALKYAVLNNTFDEVDFTHMFLHKGNTAVYLLRTYSWIRNWIRDWTGKFALNMAELSVNYAVTLEHDGERALGVHLVKFPEIMQEAIDCLSTGILCKYLYKLAFIFNKKFFAEFVSWIPFMSLDDVKRRYLLFEATRIVMSGCFELLGIKPVTNFLF